MGKSGNTSGMQPGSGSNETGGVYHVPVLLREAVDALEVKESFNPVVNLRPMDGPKRGIFAKRYIAKGTRILLGSSADSLHIYPTTSDLVYRTSALLTGREVLNIQPMIAFMAGFASQHYIYVSTLWAGIC